MNASPRELFYSKPGEIILVS